MPPPEPEAVLPVIVLLVTVNVPPSVFMMPPPDSAWFAEIVVLLTVPVFRWLRRSGW